MSEHEEQNPIDEHLEHLLSRHGIVPWHVWQKKTSGNIEARLQFVYRIFIVLMALEIAAILIFCIIVIIGVATG
jgi:hypothetical protein